MNVRLGIVGVGILVAAGLLGVLLSMGAQPGGITAGNAFVAPWMGPWAQVLRPNSHPVRTWSVRTATLARLLSFLLVLSWTVALGCGGEGLRALAGSVALLTLLLWALLGLAKVVSELA